MRKISTPVLFTSILLLISGLFSTARLNAQSTTITSPNPPYDGGNSLGAPASITFVLQNTNAYPIVLTAIGNYMTTAENNSVWELYYTSTALSGASTNVTIAPWTLVGTSSATPVTTTGITPIVFPGLNFTIPAGAQYRFALRNTGPGSTRYSGVSAISPNTLSGGGVNMLNGDFVINGDAVGYSGTGTGVTIDPRYFTGFVTFNPAGPCVNPPVPGTISTTSNPSCSGLPFTLSLSGGTGGTGQTYQWQISTDNSSWNPIAGGTSPSLTTSQTTTNYYRVGVTCGGTTVYSSSILITTPPLVSGFYTIDKSSPASPTNFQSFAAAVNYMKCGIDNVIVFNVVPNSGPYLEQVSIPQIPGASSTNTITFNGNGNSINFTSTNTNNRAGITLNGADHVTFDSIVINAGGTLTTEYGWGVHITNGADSNTIKRSRININTSSTSTNYAGVVISSSATSATTGSSLSDGNTIDRNQITGGYYGITNMGTTAAGISNNKFTNNRIVDYYFYGIYNSGTFQTLVEGNTLSVPTRTATGTSVYGIYFTSLNGRAKVSKNRINHYFDAMTATLNDFYGIYFTGSDPLSGSENVVSNNVVSNIYGNGSHYGLYNSSSDNVHYFHNTISFDVTAGAPPTAEETRGIYQITSAAGLQYKNNIVTISRGGAGPKHAIYMSTAATTFESNYNDFYIAPTATNAFVGYNGTNRTTLAEWQTASGKDANSVSMNPLYTSLASDNLTPTNPSFNNLGTPVGITIDVLDQPRGTPPDIGAYEFSVGACVAPPTAGTATSSTSVTVCPNTNVSLDLSGNSAGTGMTFTWETAPTATGPTWTAVSLAQSAPMYNLVATTTGYYRAAVTCNGITTYSTPVLVSVATPLFGGTYTINSSNPTAGTNFNSFNDAYNRMKCGIAGAVVFEVQPGVNGVYNEQLIMAAIPGASAAFTVTFNGNGNTIRFSSSNTDERAVIKLTGASHIRFDSLVIDAAGTGTHGFGVHLVNNADSNVITRCTINTNTASTSTNFAGIAISATDVSATSGSSLSDSNTISYNKINGGYYGITLIGSAAQAVSNNVIIGNTITNFYFYGIYLTGTFQTLVEANDISRPTRTTVSTFNGVFSTGISGRLQISKNRIHDPFTGITTSTSAFNGINLTGTDAPAGMETKVTNNIIYNVTGEGDEHGLYNSSSDNVHYYHNTLSFDNQASNHTTAFWTRAIYQTGAASGIDYKNNLVTITRSGQGDRHAIYMATATTTYASDHNNFYVTGQPNVTFIGFDGTDRATLAAWRAATGKDLNSLSVNPLYVNAATGNLEPRMPVLDNKGTPVGVGTDIRGAVRSTTTPDIGAIEYAIPPCTNPPTPGTTVGIPNTNICMGTPIALSLAGNSIGAGQTYQWQFATSASGTYTNLGNPTMFADTTVEASGNYYYRVAITCGATTVFSAPVFVSINPAFLSGDYTINGALPTGGVNFRTFREAVAALDCGITGYVTFHVYPGTYTEQVRMRRIAGASNTARVTFQANNGDPASATLTFGSTVAAENYTLKLDSASYITYRNLTIRAANSTNGRAIEFANTASYDSILNCRIIVPTTTTTTTSLVGVFGNAIRGGNNVIKGNTISGGASGIYFTGFSTTLLSQDNVIDSNFVSGVHFYGIYGGNLNNVRITRNTVTRSSPVNTTAYGIYSTNNDNRYIINENRVTLSGITAGTTYGIYLTGNAGTATDRGTVANNTVTAVTGNTGTIYGLYQTGSIHNNTVNNVISVKTTGATSYGLYNTGGSANNYWNNSVHNTSASPTGVAAYFSQTTFGQGPVNIRNNIFANGGSGRAVQYPNLNFIYSDYNLFYGTGAVLVIGGTTNYANLQAWRDAATWDINSIVYKPAFVSDADLRPDVANPDVWAIHGRGVQIAANNYDFNNNARPTTLTTGVPDLGAYEFLPTATPPALPATPATAAAGTTQTFMFGTDTVSKITWAPGQPVPSTIAVRRYSGVLPPGLAPQQQSMYFYTDVDVTGTAGPYNYKLQQFYIDPWQGFIPAENTIKLGRTDAANLWVVEPASRLDVDMNVITRDTLTYLDKFTGLTDGNSAPPPAPPIYVQTVDSSNRGTRFWVGYGHHQFFGSDNSQGMVLYLSAEQAATVTVRINGTPWVKTYNVPANTVITSDLIPKSGLYDARLTQEGLSDRGISIESTVPIVAYAHIYGSASSGATLLLPVGTYGYEYTALTSRQYYASNTYSWFNVIAERDNTVVEITPSNQTLGGRPAGVPFTVTLNRGQVYQVLGAIISGSEGYDMTGSRIKSVANSNGSCYPFAVFSGSSRTYITCTGNTASGGDNLIQQNFPYQAWGTRYLTAPTSNATTPTTLVRNIYRIAVKDVNTVVRVNGTPLTGLVNNFYYEYQSDSADYITSDKPIMVAQLMPSSGSCGYIGNGDPEMFYISPIEQAIKKVGFFRNTEEGITSNYLTLIIPANGLASLTIDGSNTFDYTYDHHHMPGYKVVVKRWTAVQSQVQVQSDSAFTAITYGLGSVESYGYNAGTLVKNLNSLPAITNTFNLSGGTNDYTCVRTPFRFSILIPLVPTSMTWQFSQVPGLTPNTNVTQAAPVPTGTVVINGRTYYRFTLNQDYQFNGIGTFNVPILITHPDIEGCSNTMERLLTVNVVAAPVMNFTLNSTGCVGDVVQFTGTGSANASATVNQWQWDFGNGSTSTVQNPVHQYPLAGTYNVTLRGIATDGCVGDVQKPVTINPRPVVALVDDSISVCIGSPALFTVQNPTAGVTYSWFTTQTGGTAVATGVTFSPNVTGTNVYYVEALAAGCASVARTRAVATVLPDLTAPVAVVDSAGINFVRFRWNAVQGATGYEVSENGGTTWITPASGATGLTHTVANLQPLGQANLIVRALGGCNVVQSQPVNGRALPADIFIPNSFSPNGDGLNDVLRVYGYTIAEMQFMVFNQWGEKIFESRSQNIAWDGRFKGQVQPAGVYIYVSRMTLRDGTVITKKGSINLIR